MILKVERTDARTWRDEHLKELFSEGFPEFITADRLVKEYIGRVGEWFADLNLMLVDDRDVPVASGWGALAAGAAGLAASVWVCAWA